MATHMRKSSSSHGLQQKKKLHAMQDKTSAGSEKVSNSNVIESKMYASQSADCTPQMSTKLATTIASKRNHANLDALFVSNIGNHSCFSSTFTNDDINNKNSNDKIHKNDQTLNNISKLAAQNQVHKQQQIQLQTKEHLQYNKNEHKKQEKRKVISLHKQYKRFNRRASLMTLLLSLSEFNSLYFVFLSGFGIFFASILIDDTLNKGDIYNSFELLKWNFGQYANSIQMWFVMICYVYFIVFLFHCWNNKLLFFSVLNKLVCRFSFSNKNQKYNNKQNAKYSILLSKIMFFIEYLSCYDSWYLIFYILYLMPLLYYPPKFILVNNNPCATSFFVACEQVRLLMKSHAFFVETFKTKRFWNRSIANSKKDDISVDSNVHNNINNNNNNENSPNNISANMTRQSIDISKNYNNNNTSNAHNASEIPWIVNINLTLSDQIAIFTYFLFCPSLVYRTEYPRLSLIRWNIVFSCFRDVLLTIFAVWVLLTRFCIPVYKRTVCMPGTMSELISELVNSSLPGMMMLLLGFFGFLHTWLNLFAEILRFGDRQFYLDWWNARSFAQYYRRWNCVVCFVFVLFVCVSIFYMNLFCVFVCSCFICVQFALKCSKYNYILCLNICIFVCCYNYCYIIRFMIGFIIIYI